MGNETLIFRLKNQYGNLRFFPESYAIQAILMFAERRSLKPNNIKTLMENKVRVLVLRDDGTILTDEELTKLVA